MGELGLIAMVQGPGAHLKIPPKGLCGGVVKPEEILGLLCGRRRGGDTVETVFGARKDRIEHRTRHQR